MTALAEVLHPRDLRRLNLDLFHDGEEPYLRTGAFGDLSPRQVEQKIRNVPGHKLQRLIDPIETFHQDSLPAAWSHFMALVAGTHPFPDANHRTGMLGFSEATSRAFGLLVGLPPDAAYEMGTGSKRIRDRARLKQIGKARYYRAAELGDPQHVYRRHFAAFEDSLLFMPRHL